MKSRIEVIKVSEDEVRLSQDAQRSVGQMIDDIIGHTIDVGDRLGRVVLTFDDHDHEVLSGEPRNKSASDFVSKK